MSDFIRQTAEQLAKDGFVAIAPDLLSHHGGTPPSADDARKLIAALAPDTVTQDLDATVAYVKRLKAARPDRVGVIGFCWGGGQSFRYATNNPSLGAFVVCYGPGPDAVSIARIRATGPSWRVTENCTLQLFGSANVATSPGLPPDGSPTIRPRPAARNAASKSSAAPAVALEASTAIGPPYGGRSARGATVPVSGPYQEVAESPRFHARNTARYWGVLQRTAGNGRSVRRARIWYAYSVLPSAARRRSSTRAWTRLKSGNARSNSRTTSWSAREAIRTTVTPPGSDSVAKGGGSSGQRSLRERLRVTLRPRGSAPGTRTCRWTVVPLSPWSIHAAARCQRSAGVAAETSGSTESRIQVSTGMPWTARISPSRGGRATRISSFSA